MSQQIPFWQTRLHAKLYFWVINLALPAIFLILAKVCIPTSDIFQFNPDEGIELAKVDLYQQGFQLYQQIWNDQPPLPTVLWSLWLSLWGRTLANARGLTLVFATLLVWSYGNCLRLTIGKTAAIVGVLLLIGSVNFLNLSNAVMMGLPSLAFVMLSVYGLLLSQRSPFSSPKSPLPLIWLAGSALAFAIALQLKSFVAFLIPVVFTYLLLSPKAAFASPGRQGIEQEETIKPVPLPVRGEASFGPRLLEAILWVVIVIVATYGISLFLPPPDFSQTIGGHFNAELGRFENWFYGLGDFFELFLSEIDLLILSGLTMILLPQQRQSIPIFPGLWLLFASITLFIHRPVWSHYSLLISLPVIWLATFALQQIAIALKLGKKSGSSLHPRPQKVPRKIILMGLGLCLVCLPIKGWLTFAKTQDLLRDSQVYQPVLQALMTHQHQTNWLFTDMPMFGFQANLNVPPEIAVFSQKRLRSQNLALPDIINIFDRYQPEQVLLVRFPEIQMGLIALLNQRYELQYAKKNVNLYLRKNPALPFKKS
jgi:Dolichyl-phosphate-mannose-protein mannosyltransferase